MTDIAHGAAGRKPRRLPASASSDRLDELAQRVARLGYGCRDPERFIIEKLSLAAELRQLARGARL